jgi:sulfatase modifying factor 1
MAPLNLNMKQVQKLIILAGLGIFLGGCYGGNRGELVGVLDRPNHYQADPYGMNYIHYGSFTMGPGDRSIPYLHDSRPRTVTVGSFYIDREEITNNEYRQFVKWVVDSIAHTMLGEAGIGEHLIEVNEYGEDIDPPIINWDEYIEWDDPEVREELEFMFLPEHERFYRRREIDTRKLMFEYYWVDLKAASSKESRDLDMSYTNVLGHNNAIKGHVDRSQFVVKDIINVYPDTLCWVHDFTYAFNEPMAENYFWHPAFDDYPVVGITWQQARAFNIWRSQLLNQYQAYNGDAYVNRFRLPTEAEWEYAARGGLDLSPYPWGAPYIRNKEGCPLANFKVMRGDYVDDDGFYTVPVYSYNPNDFGLYNMSGNVAEWTSTAYDESNYEFFHDMNPEYTYNALKDDPPALKRKVIRGGSWKDIEFYLQVGTRTFEYQDTAKSYIGMRSVMSYLGRGKSENDRYN